MAVITMCAKPCPMHALCGDCQQVLKEAETRENMKKMAHQNLFNTLCDLYGEQPLQDEMHTIIAAIREDEDLEKTGKVKKKTLFHLRKPFSVYFKLWQQVRNEIEDMHFYFEDAGPKRMRFELLKAHLEGRKPDWHKAPYLDFTEAERRNKSYQK